MSFRFRHCFIITVPVTTPGPITEPPFILPPTPDGLTYEESTDYHVPYLGDQFSNINGTADTYQTIEGPLGFGQAVRLVLGKSECLKQDLQSMTPETCLYDLSKCTEGFSSSVWYKPFSLSPTLNSSLTQNTYQDGLGGYILSTGGSIIGHPGIAIIQYEHWIIGIVSVAGKVWEVRSLAHVSPNFWNNVGISWKSDANEGLKLYINQTLIGSAKNPKLVEEKEQPAKREMMVGCQRRNPSEEYSGFLDAGVDELAVWNRQLNSTEIEYFNGNYDEGIANMSSALLSENIDNVMLHNPEQFRRAVYYLNLLSHPKPYPPSGQSLEEVDEESKVDLINLSNVFNTITQTKNLQGTYTEDSAKVPMRIQSALDNLLNMRNKHTWLAVQEETDKAGIMQLITGFSAYTGELHRRIWPWNKTMVHCSKKTTANYVHEICRDSLQDWREENRWLVKPSQFDLMYIDKWLNPFDKAGVTFEVFPYDDCDERILTSHAMVYSEISKAAYTGVNPAKIDNTKTQVIASNIISFNALPDYARNEDGTRNQSFPDCEADIYYLNEKYPIRIKFHHQMEELHLSRSLKFHEGIAKTDVLKRRCVRWNNALSDFGVWDPTGCLVVNNTIDYTKCACDRFGIFTILDEKMDPIEVPDEPTWLTYLKSVFHFLSIAGVILYILVVAISEDLKDQFHLIGLNLAICILLGSVTIILSDFDSVRDDRHMCVVIGTLIHFFYGGVGSWMLALGHSSFRAITKGIIGGRLESYMFMCWGLALGLCGVPFVVDLHSLGTDPRCFIAWPNQIKDIFFIPQIIYSVGALFFAVVILANLSTPLLRKENLIEDYCSFCRGAAVLQILLSLTWIFASLAFKTNVTEADFYPIFHVLNSIAGFALFLLIGLGSNRFRMFIAGQAKVRRKQLKAHAFGLPGLEGDHKAILKEDQMTQGKDYNKKE